MGLLAWVSNLGWAGGGTPTAPLVGILILAENALHNPNIPVEYSSERMGLPFKNAKLPDCTLPWQTVGDSEEWVSIDLDGFPKVNRVGIAKHNASGAEVWKIEEDDTDFSSPDHQSTSFNARPYAAGGGSSNLVTAISQVVVGTLASAATKRKLRFLAEDASNPDGFLRYGYIHFANAFEIKNCDYGWAEEYDDDTVLIASDGEIITTRPGRIRRVLHCRIFAGDLDTQQVVRKLGHLGKGFTTFLAMNPNYRDSTYTATTAPWWYYGYFRAIGPLSEGIHHGYSFNPASEFARADFGFVFEEIS
jgi:hypothetical protein